MSRIALARLIWAAIVAAIFVAAITPSFDLTSRWDKAAHVMAFAALGWTGSRLRVLAAVPAFAALIVIAIAIEAAQAALSSVRTPSLLDVGASTTGAALGVFATRGVRSVRDGLAMAALVTAVGFGLHLAIQVSRPAVTSALLDLAWREGQASGAPASPWPLAAGRAAYELDLPTASKPIVVVDNSERPALAMAPGLLPGRKPGDEGVTVLLGHRNGEFAALGPLAVGDELALSDTSGRKRLYKVSSRTIVRADHPDLYWDEPGELLALITCWPIESREPGPWRLIVRARAVSPAPDMIASRG